MKAQQSIVIKASSERIFSYLMTVENRVDYIPALDEVIMLDEGPIRVGSRYIEVAEIAGRKLKTTYQVIEFEKNRHTAAKTIKSIFPIRADLDLTQNQNDTLLVITLSFQLNGIFKLASRIVEGIVNQQAIGILKRIKSNVESATVKSSGPT